MRFLVDAQLPRRLVFRLREAGHDALHTLDLPNANRTTDAEIIALSMRDGRVVVTKDADFVNSFFLVHRPPKLLLISTGNIRNTDLEALMVGHMAAIVAALGANDCVELTRTALIIRA
jgi:predicted nuclease of predicted toxin-antitoxin system